MQGRGESSTTPPQAISLSTIDGPRPSPIAPANGAKASSISNYFMPTARQITNQNQTLEAMNATILSVEC